MQRAMVRRKRAFLRALATARMSQAAFARQLKISPAHLSFVVNGKRDSDTLTEKIDAFIAEHDKPVTAVA